MSVRFTPTSYVYRASGLPAGNLITVSIWIYISVDINNYAFFWGYGPVNLILNSDGVTLTLYGAVPGFVTGSALSLGQWYHIGYVRNGTSHTVYLDGVSNITNTSDPATTATLMMVGADSGGGNAFNGRCCSFKCWNAALTLDELLLEKQCIAVVRTANLANFWPLLAPTEAVDQVDKSALNPSGTMTLEENPPIPWRVRSIEQQITTVEAAPAPSLLYYPNPMQHMIVR